MRLSLIHILAAIREFTQLGSGFKIAMRDLQTVSYTHLKRVFSDMGIGRVETVAGAHGGIRYVPQMPANVRMLLVKELTEKMRDTSRILPGGYMYIADLFCTPYYVDGMAQIMAEWFVGAKADFIVTVETKGIPLAMSEMCIRDRCVFRFGK